MDCPRHIRAAAGPYEEGYRSCFYRRVPVGEETKEKGLALEFTETEKVFDPKDVYGDAPNPTKL